ncbi:MAG TPA: DUF2231 domain-containing protein [Ignavibacteriaceae bacterium]|nr:DUF2231 domain-containing protein [Ignavibacteriaceae bacterium]
MMQFVENIIKGRLFGHPIHMMLVHFPAALFPVSAVLCLLSYIQSDSILSLFNFYIICTGTVIGWIALIFGLIDLLKFQKDKKPFMTGIIHGSLNTLWLSVFSVLGGIQIKFYPSIPVPSLTAVIIEIIVVLIMLYSNHLGGELVLRYSAGMDEDFKSGRF